MSMNEESIQEISRTNKLLQFLGICSITDRTLVNSNKPIYIRGDTVPMRTDKKYLKKKVVTSDERMSFGRINNFLKK